MTLLRPSISLLVAVGFAACGSETTGPGNGNGGGNVREIVQDPSFATHINEIFTRTGCTGGNCHGTGGNGATQTGLVLEAGSAANYGRLVSVSAMQDPNLFLVNPGNAAMSYLVIKLSSNPPTGMQMPRNGAPLDNIDMTNIRNWINNDAPNN